MTWGGSGTSNKEEADSEFEISSTGMPYLPSTTCAPMEVTVPENIHQLVLDDSLRHRRTSGSSSLTSSPAVLSVHRQQVKRRRRRRQREQRSFRRRRDNTSVRRNLLEIIGSSLLLGALLASTSWLFITLLLYGHEEQQALNDRHSMPKDKRQLRDVNARLSMAQDGVVAKQVDQHQLHIKAEPSLPERHPIVPFFSIPKQLNSSRKDGSIGTVLRGTQRKAPPNLSYERADTSTLHSNNGWRVRDSISSGFDSVCTFHLYNQSSPPVCRIEECQQQGLKDNQRIENPQNDHFPAAGFVVRDDSVQNHTTSYHIPHTMALNGCVVSHKYRFVYIHVLKSGGMTFKTFLKKALCNGETVMPCVNGKQVLQVAHCRSVLSDPSIQDNDRPYLIWSVVRNPFQRMHSGYAMAQQFALQNFTFSDFVLKRHKRGQFASTDPVHYAPQHEFLFNQHDCPIVNHILRMETIQQDLPRLLDQIKSAKLSGYYRRNGLGHENDTDYGRRRIQEYGISSWKNMYSTQDLIDRVIEDYQTDFDILGYETNFP